MHTSEFEYTARAMETLCFCPPLMLTPLSPISVRSPPCSRICKAGKLNIQINKELKNNRTKKLVWQQVISLQGAVQGHAAVKSHLLLFNI